MKFIQLTRNDFLSLPETSKMASEIDEIVDPCRKMKMILKNLNVNVENKKNKKNKYISAFKSCKLSLKFHGLRQTVCHTSISF